MVNERIKELAKQAQKVVGYTDGGYTEIKALDQEKFGQGIVGETILAILATDCRDLTVTTYDKQFVDGVISRVVDSVRDHWEFK